MEDKINKTNKKYVIVKPSTHRLLCQLKLDLDMSSLSKTIRYLISEHNKTKQSVQQRADV